MTPMPAELAPYYRRYDSRDRDVLHIADAEFYRQCTFTVEPVTDAYRQITGRDGYAIIAHGPTASGDPGSWVFTNGVYAREEAEALLAEALALRPILWAYQEAEARERAQEQAGRRAARAAAREAWITAHGRRPYVCADCGAYEDRAALLCPLSEDGEGNHDWVDDVPLDPEFEARWRVHMEQGAQER